MEIKQSESNKRYRVWLMFSPPPDLQAIPPDLIMIFPDEVGCLFYISNMEKYSLSNLNENYLTELTRLLNGHNKFNTAISLQSGKTSSSFCKKITDRILKNAILEAIKPTLLNRAEVYPELSFGVKPNEHQKLITSFNKSEEISAQRKLSIALLQCIESKNLTLNVSGINLEREGERILLLNHLSTPFEIVDLSNCDLMDVTAKPLLDSILNPKSSIRIVNLTNNRISPFCLQMFQKKLAKKYYVLFNTKVLLDAATKTNYKEFEYLLSYLNYKGLLGIASRQENAAGHTPLDLAIKFNNIDLACALVLVSDHLPRRTVQFLNEHVKSYLTEKIKLPDNVQNLMALFSCFDSTLIYASKGFKAHDIRDTCLEINNKLKRPIEEFLAESLTFVNFKTLTVSQRMTYKVFFKESLKNPYLKPLLEFTHLELLNLSQSHRKSLKIIIDTDRDSIERRFKYEVQRTYFSDIKSHN